MSLSSDGKPYRCAPLTVMKSAPGRWARASSANLSSSSVIDHPPAGTEQEAVDPVVIGPLRQGRGRERLLKDLIQPQRAGSHFLEGQTAGLDPEQLVAVLAHIDQDRAGFQGVDAAVEQPDQ